MVMDFLLEYGLVIAFYVGVSLLVYINRDKFEFQGKIIALYKTKFGIKAMKRFATPLQNWHDFGKGLFTIGLYSMLFFGVLAGLDRVLSLFELGFLESVVLLEDAGVAVVTLFELFVALAVAAFLLVCVSIVFFKQVKKMGTLSIYAGFIGMVLIVVMIAYGVYQLFFEPSAPAMFSPVIPGFNIPGGIHLPLIEGLLALFVVIVIHEFSHGIVSKAYGIPIKSSGFVMFGPIPGAFVEPDEEKLEDASDHVQLSILGAGPFSNVLLFGVLFLVTFAFTFFIVGAYQPGGLTVDGFTDEALDGVVEGDRIISFNGEEIRLLTDLQRELTNTSPGDVVTLGLQNGDVDLELRENPNNANLSWVGVTLSQVVEPATNNQFLSVMQAPLFWLFGSPWALSLGDALGLVQWIFILSLGIGLVNLLPVGPVDGGRMYLIAMKRYLDEDLAKSIWAWTSKVLFVTLIILVLVPIARAILG